MYPNYNNYMPNYGQNFGQQNFGQKYEIIRVSGRNGGETLSMAPNSEALLLDTTASIVWLAQTDGAGYKTLTPYSIAPYQPEPEIDIKSIDARLRKIEETINAKSDTPKVGKSKSE